MLGLNIHIVSMKTSIPGQFRTCIRNFHSCLKEKSNAWTFFCMKLKFQNHAITECVWCVSLAHGTISWTNIAIVTRWLLGWGFLNVPSWLHCRFINVAWNTSLSWLVSWISTSPELEKILISFQSSGITSVDLWGQVWQNQWDLCTVGTLRSGERRWRKLV